jgi:subtilisin family serine protease
MNARLTLITICFFFVVVSFGQTAAVDSYWVQFRDKKGTPFQISHPEKFLSQRAIERRLKQHIAIDSTDLPVSPVYLDSLKKLGLQIFHTSKWLNGSTVRTADTALISRVKKLGFIAEVQLTKPALMTKSTTRKFNEPEVSVDINPETYGNALAQLEQLDGEYLHNSGYRGKGIQIAVLDAGFWHASQIAAFDSLFNSGRILGTRDFVDPTSDIYQQHSHGMSVLSCMGGNVPDRFVGTAPDASFYLFRTEDVSSEYLIEEDNWVAAAEYADSLGVDEINSSLGYFTFDDSLMNHTYADMDGKTTRVTRGANLAFQKGILVFTSAGNEGNNPWKHIIAPSDGTGVIGVAAVDQNGNRAPFSSVGPAYSGAVKPNVAARGSGTYLVTGSGTLGTSSGTSFSSPVLAGVGACLLQANRFANVQQVKFAIEQSASQYNSPDSLLGYGIPDFALADKYLKLNSYQQSNPKITWIATPNPFTGHLFITNPDLKEGTVYQVGIYNLQGVCLMRYSGNTSGVIFLKNLSALPDGLLILSVNSGGKEERLKVIKTTP